MSEEKNMIQAQEVYKVLCKTLDAREWEYEKEEDKLLVHLNVRGDDFPIQLVLVVDADRQLIRVMSYLPFDMSQDKRLDGVIAACVLTNRLAAGSFDYNFSNGKVLFRLNQCFRGSVIGEGLIEYLLDCACTITDEYNDKFFALNKGFMSIEDFLKM